MRIEVMSTKREKCGCNVGYGNKLTVSIAGDDTVETVKVMLNEQYSMILDNQYLYYCGRKLEDSRTLSCYGIGVGSVLRLVYKEGGDYVNYSVCLR